MKILLCTTTFRDLRNGPTKFAHLLYSKKDNPDAMEFHILSEDSTGAGERLHHCKIGWMKKVLPVAPIYRMYKYYRKARQLDKKYQFEWVLYNNAIYGIIHSYFDKKIVGFINDYNNQKNISSKNGLFNYSFIKKYIFKRLEGLAIGSLRLIITNSDYLKKLLQTSYSSEAKKFKRLYKGIELHNSNNNNFSWSHERTSIINLLFVKSDFITGGLKILAESMALIDKRFVITIVGPADRFFSEINTYFSYSNNNIQVNFLSKQSQQSVFALMQTNHVFCVPSLQEALGVANLEALNIGIPVVSSDAGGIPEVLDYGNCGFIAKSGDVRSLKNSLEECIFNQDARIEKVKNGFEHVKKFKIDLMFKNLKTILAEVD